MHRSSLALALAAVGLLACSLSPSTSKSRDDDDGAASDGGGGSLGSAMGGAGGAHAAAGGAEAVGGAGGMGGQPAVADYSCSTAGGGGELRDAANQLVATYSSLSECQQALDDRGEGVVCAWFELGMPIGPGAWDEVGWRAMNIDTKVGLGRRPHTSFANCLDATRSARGGVVCTNTGVGYKSAHINTNMWCGASSNLPYCLQASVAAKNYFVCSFPSDGDGSGPGWVLTEIAGTTCNYMTASMPLTQCNGMIP